YVKGDKIRREYTNPAGTTIFIIPGDQPIMWMFEPQIPTYTELPYDKAAFSKKLNLTKEGGGSKLVGTETLHGYVTDKYETAVKTPTGTRPGTIWISKKLGVPIRIETADKLFVQEYKDIKEGRLDDVLFELPSGYQKKAMRPGMPK
ncbi:MAG TPA: hypothetical protein VIN67_07595, partial [Desulfobaccales bacterium]